MGSTKLTFKRGERVTGLASVASPYPQTYIKLNKQEVGFIQPPSFGNADANWRVWVRKIDTSTRAGWRNVCFKAKFDDEKSARAWVARNEEKIIAMGLAMPES